MKQFSFVVLIVAVVALSTAKPALDISQEQKAKLDQYREECKAQSGVDVEVLKKLREGVFPEDPKLKDFLLCVSKKANFQNETGEIQETVIIEKLGNAIHDTDKAKALISKCVVQEGSPADVVFNMITCLYNSTPNHIVIIH